MRADREPSKYSKVCSCHFREGKKSAGPEIFKRNADKLFPLQENNSEKKRKRDSKVNSSAVNDIMKIFTEARESSEKTQNGSTQPASTEQIILEAELDNQARAEVS